MAELRIGSRTLSEDSPTYFVADIAANHDGDLDRAKMLIHLAKEAGVDAAKFQHFQAAKIVSDQGYRSLEDPGTHQSTWKKSVFEVYEDYSMSQDWTPILKEECDKVGIDFFSSPYDFESVDHLEPYVDIYKIGSGEITWLEMLEYIAKKSKPVFLGTGAANLNDVQIAVDTIMQHNENLVLIQCNTNYTADRQNLHHVNLSVLNKFRAMYPDLVLGLSDHTSSLAVPIGAIALGARVIERHFTDDNSRIGPDHKFASDHVLWKEMIELARDLESAIGDGVKRIEENEMQSIVVQQRSLRVARDIDAGTILERHDIEVLRPAPFGSIKPQHLSSVIGRSVSQEIKGGDLLRWEHLI